MGNQMDCRKKIHRTRREFNRGGSQDLEFTSVVSTTSFN
jgi:hypothetical protein